MAIGSPSIKLPTEKTTVEYQQLTKNTAHISNKDINTKQYYSLSIDKELVCSRSIRDIVKYEDTSLEEIFSNNGIKCSEKFNDLGLFIHINEDIMNLLVKNLNLSKFQFLKIMFFLSNLYCKECDKAKYKKFINKNYEKNWIGLDSRVLHQIYTSRDWGIMRYFLEKFEIIRINDEYKVRNNGKSDGYCKSFRLTKKYKKDFKLVKICETGYLVKKLSKCIDENVKLKKPKKKKDSEIEIKMEEPNYIDENSEKIKDYLLSVFKSAKFNNSILDINFDNKKEKDDNLLKAAKFNNENYSYSRKQKTGRIFHQFSSMSDKLRKSVKIDGKKCAELDFANMQPCCFSLLYNKKRKRSLDEYNKFILILESGEFYKYLMEVSKGVVNWSECAHPKDEIMKQVMFSYYNPEKYPLLPIFKEKFPILTNRIRALKWKNYKKFSWIIQKEESNFMINTLLVELMNKNIKAIPVHDSIICKESDLFAAEEIMTKLFVEKFGFSPKIKKSS